MSTKKFPLIELSGSPQEIGLKHGEILKDKIHATVAWYKRIISKDEKRLLKLAANFKSIITNFDNSYVSEIEAIAVGADIDPIWIYMLNARSEIMNVFQNECTAIFFKNSAILGQNWDWAQDLENLAVLMKLKIEDKPEILMITEPGIIGKIGFNSLGVGVCLNFLDSGKSTRGVPIHLILRKILESSSITNALKIINPYMLGKSGNILIGDSNGHFVDIEFADDKVYHLRTDKNIFLHTNHYLENEELNQKRVTLESSFKRFETGIRLTQEITSQSVENMKRILLDRSDEMLPICRAYVDNPDIGTVGTICALIMDLRNLKMHITRGSPLETPFTMITFV